MRKRRKTRRRRRRREKKIVVKTKMYIIHENCNQEKHRYGKANQITKMKPRKF